MTGQADPRRDATPATRAANAAMAAGLAVRGPPGLRGGRARADRAAAGRRPGDRHATAVWCGICRDSTSSTSTRRRPTPSTRASGGRSQLVVQGGLYKVVRACTRCARSTCRTSRSSRATTGLIVFDPLISAETARRRWSCTTRTDRAEPVVAVVLLAQPRRPLRRRPRRRRRGRREGRQGEDRRARAGSCEAAVAENVLAGNVMSRRASYMYGNLLPADPTGQVGAGLGVTTSSGTVTLIPPTHEISETGQRMNDRRPRLRVHDRARQRGAGGDALVHRAVQGA